MENLNYLIEKILSNEIIKKDDNISENIKSIIERIRDSEFRVAIVGEFSSGKSTFINSIIGSDILKHATVETTAIVTYIHNVSRDNELYNKCKVTFKNGNEEFFYGYENIKEYTTTISKYDVVNEIDRVDLYLNYFKTDKKIVIIDTPGLNGVADKHREITIDEIKKAHACIYLFQKNGITDSDKEFIEFLCNYQNRFIFIQNFIDELKKSENETVEDKIIYIDNFINEKIFSKNMLEIKYDIFGISALKGLAGKDKNIEYLYEGDLFKIDDIRRESILKESNVLKVEETILNILESEEISNIIENSVRHALIKILSDILEREQIFLNRNYELLKEDKIYKNKDKIESSLNNLKEQESVILEKIDNLVISEFNKNIRLLKENIEESVEKIEENINSLIELEKNYEEFNYKYKNKYYINELKSLIDKYKQELEINEYSVIQHIYKTMLNRLSFYTDYSIDEVKKFDGINFKQSNIKELKIEFRDKESKINQLKEELIDGRGKISIYKKEIKDINEDKIEINYLEKKLKDELDKIDKEKNLREKSLGKKPKREIIDYMEITELEERGFWGSLFLGPKEVKKSIPIYNDNNIAEWNNKNNIIQREYINNKSKIEKEIQRINEKKTKLEIDLKENNSNLDRNKMQIEYLERQIKIKEEELEVYKTTAKNEHMRMMKDYLKKDIKSYLEEGDYNVKNILKQKMNSDMNLNKEKIREESKKNCIIYIEKEKERLNDLMNESNETLNERYKKNEKHIENLVGIYKDLTGESQNESI